MPTPTQTASAARRPQADPPQWTPQAEVFPHRSAPTPRRPALSFELFPPRSRATEESLLRTLEELAPTAPDYVSVTAAVAGERRRRSLDLLDHLVRGTAFRPLAHVIATGQSRSELRGLLEEILGLGVRGILALRGDRPEGHELGPDELPFARHLVELVREVEQQNRARLGAGRLSVGVAAYPVRHPESPSIHHDLEVLLAKQRAGADFAITQVYPHPRDYARLVERARETGVDLPIIPGIFPATGLRRYLTVCRLAGLEPDRALAHRLETASGPAERRRIGVDAAEAQARAALDAGAEGLHLYTFNEHPAALELLDRLDLGGTSGVPAAPRTRLCSQRVPDHPGGRPPSGSQPGDESPGHPESGEPSAPRGQEAYDRRPANQDPEHQNAQHQDPENQNAQNAQNAETRTPTVSTTQNTAAPNTTPQTPAERAADAEHSGGTECSFPSATVLGYPRLGPRRELKKALEKHWAGRIDAAELCTETTQLRVRTVQRLRDLGLTGCSAVPAAFSLYDQVLDAIVATGALPSRFSDLADSEGRIDRDASFVLARGDETRGPLEMTKWFDTNYHYLVPEIGPDTAFAAHPEEALGQLSAGTYSPAGAAALRPVLVGPVTFLLLAKAEDTAPEGFDPLERLEDLLPVYSELIAALGRAGARWVQLDEPALVADQDRPGLAATVRGAYSRLVAARAAEDPALLVTTPYGDAEEHLAALAGTGVEAVHTDLASGRGGLRSPDPEALAAFARPGAPVLVAGVVDGRNVWRTDLDAALEVLEGLREAGATVCVSTSTSLQHVPHDLDLETSLPEEPRKWLAFADQKVRETVLLATALEQGREAVAEELARSRAALASRTASESARNAAVRERVGSLTEADAHREPAARRRAVQAVSGAAAGLPALPTTTIGSFPQTPRIRTARADHRAGRLDHQDYVGLLREEIAQTIRLQEELDLDVLVHGEAERNDMVQYFAENFEGFEVTEHGWVQSYGSRCTRPSILWGDVSRAGEGLRGEAFTVPWITWAQSQTSRPVKGMLTGPVTILAWSFVREDQPLGETAAQVALALRDEVADLEEAGIGIIQVDEPALRELLPLRRRDHADYLDWSVRSFRLATSAVRPETQIHTHLCYSEFAEVLSAIDALDADVTSVEAARSRMELLEPLRESGFERGIGPGVWDIHSPRVPTTAEITGLLREAARVVPADRLWANPDCGLKTRAHPETVAALEHLVAAARTVRAEIQDAEGATGRPEDARTAAPAAGR